MKSKKDSQVIVGELFFPGESGVGEVMRCPGANDVQEDSWSCFMRQVCGKNKMERFVVYAAFLSSPFRGSGPLWRWMPLYTSSGV